MYILSIYILGQHDENPNPLHIHINMLRYRLLYITYISFLKGSQRYAAEKIVLGHKKRILYIM